MEPVARRLLRVVDFGRRLVPYADGLKIQDAVYAARREGTVADTLLLLQHGPVFTIGKRGRDADFKVPTQEVEKRGAEIFTVPRGGEVTFHGPGQMVAYPIIDIRAAKLGARAFVEGLEDTVIATIGRHGISGRGRLSGATGVWVGERKIAAIGVKLSHGVSSHGLALNVSTDLSFFDLIVPCGIPDKAVTSITLECRGRSTPPAAGSGDLRPAGSSSSWGAGSEEAGPSEDSSSEGTHRGEAGHPSAGHSSGSSSSSSRRESELLYGKVSSDFVQAFKAQFKYEAVERKSVASGADLPVESLVAEVLEPSALSLELPPS